MSQNSAEPFLLKVPQRTRTCSKSTAKNTGTASVNGTLELVCTKVFL